MAIAGYEAEFISLVLFYKYSKNNYTTKTTAIIKYILIFLLVLSTISIIAQDDVIGAKTNIAIVIWLITALGALWKILTDASSLMEYCRALLWKNSNRINPIKF